TAVASPNPSRRTLLTEMPAPGLTVKGSPKLLPLNVTVVATPTSPNAGLMEVSIGTAGLITKEYSLLTAPSLLFSFMRTVVPERLEGIEKSAVARVELAITR